MATCDTWRPRVYDGEDGWFIVALRGTDQVRNAARAMAASGDEASAKRSLNQSIERLCGISADALCQITPEHVEPTLAYLGDVQRSRAAQLAMFMALLGEIGGRDDQVCAALCLLVFALHDLEGLERSAAGPLVDLIERVDLQVLGDDMLRRIAHILELVDRLHLAEHVLFVWIDRDVRAAFEDAIAFYGRQQKRTTARLTAGGFSVQRVLDGLDMLQEAAGADRPRREGPWRRFVSSY